MLIDVHSHIDLFDNPQEIIRNSKKIKIVTAGVNSDSNKKILELKKENPEIEICLGGYPTELSKLFDEGIDSEIEFIRKNNKNIVGIGEVGLDLKENDESTLEKQKKYFGKFIELAKELNKPIIVHSRKAEKECVEFLERFNYKKIIMHCFSGNFKLVQKIIQNGWYLSIPTSVKNSEHFQKIIEIAPIEQLFCETDSPFLHPDRKFPNEPKNVVESYKKIAEIKNISMKEVEKKIGENYKRLFNICS